MMEGQYWARPVEIELAGIGHYRTIQSTDAAARCLLYKWPDRTSKAYNRAKGLCLDALEGRRPDEEARQAFIDAADAARIFVRTQ